MTAIKDHTSSLLVAFNELSKLFSNKKLDSFNYFSILIIYFSEFRGMRSHFTQKDKGVLKEQLLFFF